MRLTIKSFLFAILMGTVFVNLYFYFLSAKSETVNCESPVIVTSRHKSFQFNGTIGVTLNPGGTGSVAFSGEINRRGEPSGSVLLRIIYFNYSVEHYSYLTLANFVIKKNINDHTDDAIFDKLIFDFHDKTRRVRVEKIADSAYLIENAFNPIFVCIKK